LNPLDIDSTYTMRAEEESMGHPKFHVIIVGAGS
jgi:hypothetical protein